MCECGCMGSGSFYKLPVGRGYLVVHLYPGCANCSAPPSVIIRKPSTDPGDRDYEKGYAELPFNTYGKKLPEIPAECVIICGPDKDQMRSACGKIAADYEVDGGKLGDDLAEEIGGEVWDEVINKAPFVMEEK